jgi:hypothetical protein
MTSHEHTFARFLATKATSSVVVGSLMLVTPCARSQTYGEVTTNIHHLPPVIAQRGDTAIGKHGADTYQGNKVSGMSGGEKAGIAAGIVGAALVTIWAVHHAQNKQPSSEDFMRNGPQVPPNVLMSHLIVDGVIGPNWPFGLDFQIEGKGSVSLDITTADKVQYHQELTNNLNGRGITITYPDGLPDKLQPATFDVEAIAPAGSNDPPPSLRVYGMACGPHAVGSIAIDQVKFGPSELKLKQDAQYGFHSHSDFSNVRADLMFTGLKDQHIVMKQDDEVPLSPVAQDEHAQGSLATKGTAGQHLLQIRAWRGNSGDWVVAWSPDVVNLSK